MLKLIHRLTLKQKKNNTEVYSFSLGCRIVFFTNLGVASDLAFYFTYYDIICNKD